MDQKLISFESPKSQQGHGHHQIVALYIFVGTSVPIQANINSKPRL